VTELSEADRDRISKNQEAARKRLSEKRAAAEVEVVVVEAEVAQINPEQELPQQDNTPGPPPPKRKRVKTDLELEREAELKNVVSQGQIVRVHGTKLIDTGGGFLLEEKDLAEETEAEKVIVVQPAGFVPTDAPSCELCQREFSDSFLFSKYDHPVCDACKDTDDLHSFITRTDAKNEYLLKDEDFDKREPLLKFMLRPNPHNPRWGDMKLYLRLQIEKRAIEVWGTLDKIEEQRVIREESRVKTKVKKYNKKMQSLRMSARSSLYTRDLSAHEHAWGKESYDDDSDIYSHTCIDCGQVETYEKM